jgi:hypothetical protein
VKRAGQREPIGECRTKRPYGKPELARLGRLADITHGPSIGLNESGNPQVFKV